MQTDFRFGDGCGNGDGCSKGLSSNRHVSRPHANHDLLDTTCGTAPAKDLTSGASSLNTANTANHNTNWASVILTEKGLNQIAPGQ